jgi:SAM-dependent methyltransferase
MRVDEILKWVRGPAVLDVGCTSHPVEMGSRFWLHGRLREHFEVTGIDISEENVEQMRRRGLDRLHVANAEEFWLAERFDTIVAGELIEHLSNPGRFLLRAREHLKPDGRLVLTTPYVFSLMYACYAFFHFPKTCENQQHSCWFCLQTLRELAGRAGFKVIHEELVEDYRPDVPDPRYRAFVFLIRTLGRLLPGRMRKNAILLVLQPGN